MVSQEVVQTEFSVVHGLTRMHGLTRNEDIYSFLYADADKSVCVWYEDGLMTFYTSN